MAKKDDRQNFAWLYGQQARRDGKERAVPEFWTELAEAWLKGFDGEPLGILGAGSSDISS